jgi:hypothetical protein
MWKNELYIAMRDKIGASAVVTSYVGDRVFDEEGTVNASLPHIVMDIVDDPDSEFLGTMDKRLKATLKVKIWSNRDLGPKYNRTIAEAVWEQLDRVMLADDTNYSGIKIQGTARGDMTKSSFGYETDLSFMVLGTVSFYQT